MQWRSKGGQVGVRAPGRRPWWRINTPFQPFKNVILSSNLDQYVGEPPHPRPPRCYSQATVKALLKAFLTLKAMLSAKNKSSNSKCSAFAASPLLLVFFTF